MCHMILDPMSQFGDIGVNTRNGSVTAEFIAKGNHTYENVVLHQWSTTVAMAGGLRLAGDTDHIGRDGNALCSPRLDAFFPVADDHRVGELEESVPRRVSGLAPAGHIHLTSHKGFVHGHRNWDGIDAFMERRRKVHDGNVTVDR